MCLFFPKRTMFLGQAVVSGEFIFQIQSSCGLNLSSSHEIDFQDQNLYYLRRWLVLSFISDLRAAY